MQRKVSKLKLARVMAGLTQLEVEAETGIVQTIVSRLERGLKEPNEAQLVTLANLYGVDPSELQV
jgi:transcriptional regulator with XRE-family HTH domain